MKDGETSIEGEWKISMQAAIQNIRGSCSTSAEVTWKSAPFVNFTSMEAKFNSRGRRGDYMGSRQTLEPVPASMGARDFFHVSRMWLPRMKASPLAGWCGRPQSDQAQQTREKFAAYQMFFTNDRFSGTDRKPIHTTIQYKTFSKETIGASILPHLRARKVL